MNKELIEAIIKGKYKKARKLLNKNHYELNIKTEDGYIPLFTASACGHESIARLLIENGADVNMADNYKNTPLHRAAENRNEKTVRLLIENGADVNKKNDLGEKPFEFKACAECGIAESEIKSKSGVSGLLKSIKNKKLFCSDCQIKLGIEPECDMCGRTSSTLEKAFDDMEKKGMLVFGSGPVLQWCSKCKKYFCGSCQVDLGEKSGCPVCNKSLEAYMEFCQ